MSKSNKIMIQVCLCGAGTKKAQAPTVPYTADELAEQIVACAKAGASIAHIHVREDKLVNGEMQIGYKSMSLKHVQISEASKLQFALNASCITTYQRSPDARVKKYPFLNYEHVYARANLHEYD